MLMGLDVGTTGVKACVFDEIGNIRGFGFCTYDIILCGPDKAEQDAEKIWNCVKYVIQSAVHESKGEISAIGVSVQGDAVIPVDQYGNALEYAQLGMDYRGKEEAEQASINIGDYKAYSVTGMRVHPLNSIIKIDWIKKHNPKLYAKTYKFVTYSDYILKKLGSDEFVIDYSMASRTMAFDISSREWSKEILQAFDIDKNKLSIPVKSGSIVGKVSSNICEELGLGADVLLVAGGHDQTCAALGAGVIKEGIALDSHGTAEVIGTSLDSLHINKLMFEHNYPCYYHVVPDKYYTFGLNHTSGLLFQWLIEEIYGNQGLYMNNIFESIYGEMRDEPSNLILLPYFNGRGTPFCDTDRKGSIFGLTLKTRKSDIARAVVDSLCYEMRINIEVMKSAGIPIKEIRCVGGGSKSVKGVSAKADVLNMPVSTMRIKEAACLGAGILAGIACQIYRDIEEAVDTLVKIDKIFYPRETYVKKHDINYNQYLNYGKLMI